MGSQLLIVGPPGTGKTEADLGMIGSWIKADVPIERIAYGTFLKAAAGEACERFGIEPRDARELWFRTLHSMAFRMLGITRDAVVTSSWLAGFGKRIGLKTVE